MSERRPFTPVQSRTWWAHKPYLAYTIRELSGVAVALYGGILLAGLVCLWRGPEAYAVYSSPVGQSGIAAGASAAARRRALARGDMVSDPAENAAQAGAARPAGVATIDFDGCAAAGVRLLRHPGGRGHDPGSLVMTTPNPHPRPRRSIAPVFWLLFGAGGMLSALFGPALIILTGIMAPHGWGLPSSFTDFASAQAFVRNPIGKL